MDLYDKTGYWIELITPRKIAHANYNLEVVKVYFISTCEL
jgi:hypothetical protein